MGAGGARGAGLVGPALFLLSFASGKSTFPLDASISRNLPICELDVQWGDEEEEAPPQMPLRHLPVAAWTAIAPEPTFSRARRLAATFVRLNISEADAVALAMVMLSAGRPGYQADRPNGVAGRLHDALALAAANTIFGGQQAESGG